ncbi:MAG: hypothetical protein ABJC04_08845 [Verrucomicrobiota bacterium]
MKSPDENTLLNEILAHDQLSHLRRTSLDGALGVMRQSQRRRRALRAGMCALLPLVFLAAFVWLKPASPSAEAPIAKVSRETSTTAVSPQTSVKIISDEELFALFPGRSLALIGKPGHQELVFLDAPHRN